MSAPPAVKLAVQRTARGLERELAAGDLEAARRRYSPDFAARDTELGPLLELAARAELIGTVATRTLFHLRLDDGTTRVIELLWRDHEGSWLIDDCRVFSLLPGE
jgi:hypothetical protein